MLLSLAKRLLEVRDARPMAAASLPVEWIRGNPREGWFAGSLGTVMAIVIPASLLYGWLDPPFPYVG